MGTVGIALTSKSNRLFWEALAQFLQKEFGLDLFKVMNEEDMERFLKNDSSRVLIVEHGAEPSSLESAGPHWSDYHYRQCAETNPRIAIVAIDATGLETFVRLKDLGRDLLVKLVSAILTENVQDDMPVAESGVTVLRAADVIKLAPKHLSLNDEPPPSAPEENIWQIVCQWLDLCFHLCLNQNTLGDGNDGNLPGWTMSSSAAREIIGGEYALGNEDTLRRQYEILEAKVTGVSRDSDQNISKLASIYDAFCFSSLEKKILLLCLACELDGRYTRVFGYLNDDLTRRRLNLTLLKRLLFDTPQSIWELRSAVTGCSTLGFFQIIKSDPSDAQPASEKGLMVSSDIINYLMHGTDGLLEDALYLEFKSAQPLSQSIEQNHSEINLRAKLAQWCTKPTQSSSFQRTQKLPMMQLSGNAVSLDWFIDTCRQSGERLLVFDISELASADNDKLLETSIFVARTARLYRAILIVTGFDVVSAKDHGRLVNVCVTQLYPRLTRMVCHFEEPYIMPGEQKVWYIEREALSYNDTKSMWRRCLETKGVLLAESDLSVLATSLSLKAAEVSALVDGLDNSENIGASDILRAAKPFRRVSVPSGICRIHPRFTWRDIVLPSALLDVLSTIPGHVRDAGKVLDDWGYRARMPYGHGVTALFGGPSGTGKTMAAQIIAAELSVELFQVDLSKTVSKYIGETEKNLDTIFNAAEQAGAVLLFDEADALFGKRTEVKDAHDRYANVEVAYLLQRMEMFSGLAILTTNLKQNLDKAFMRRLRFVVDFHMPAAKEREAIWQASFPQDAPLAEDVNFKFLARRLELAGGNIQQIAIRAAFNASAVNSSIQMHHIVRTTCEELRKLGMDSLEKSLAEYIPSARCSGYE